MKSLQIGIVPRKLPRPGHHALAVRDLVAVVQNRFDALTRAGGLTSDWQRLQFDAMGAFVQSQKHFVALHAEILAVIQSNKVLFASLRLASLDMSQAIAHLRDLIGAIANAMQDVERN